MNWVTQDDRPKRTTLHLPTVKKVRIRALAKTDRYDDRDNEPSFRHGGVAVEPGSIVSVDFDIARNLVELGRAEYVVSDDAA